MDKEEKEDIKKDIAKYNAISAILKTEGGKILKEELEDELVSLINELISKYKTKTEDKLIPIIAGMDKTLKLLKKLTDSENGKALAMEALKKSE